MLVAVAEAMGRDEGVVRDGGKAVVVVAEEQEVVRDGGEVSEEASSGNYQTFP